MLEILLGQIVGKAIRGVPSQDPFVAEVQTWMSVLLENAPGHWKPIVLSGIACADPRGCGRRAVAACSVCRKPTCLGHSFVSASAAAVCFHCVRQTAAGATGSAHDDVQTPRQATDDDKRRAHLKTMNLPASASLDEIRAAFKKHGLKYHPDRVGRMSESKRVAAAQKFAKITEAYHWLIDHTQEKAA